MVSVNSFNCLIEFSSFRMAFISLSFLDFKEANEAYLQNMAYAFLSNQVCCALCCAVVSHYMLVIIILSHWLATKRAHYGIRCMSILEMLFGQISRTKKSIACRYWAMFYARKFPFLCWIGTKTTDMYGVIIDLVLIYRRFIRRWWRIIARVLKLFQCILAALVTRF